MRHRLISVFLLIALLLQCVCVSAETASELAKGARGDDVARLQARLIELHYLTGKADGIYGADTNGAVSDFQKGARLPQTGTADPETQALLFSDAALDAHVALLHDLSSGDKGAAVTRLQTRLEEFGLLSGTIDGEYGKKTVAAVKLLERALLAQSVAGAKADGRMNVSELEAFYADDFIFYTGDYGIGDEDVSILALETRLRALRYIDTTPDETLDEHTADALRLFQQNAQLPATGTLDRATVARLDRADAPVSDRIVRRSLQEGDSGATVEEMEVKLAQWGFLDVLPGGTFDESTVNALGRLMEYFTKLGDAAPEWARYLTADDAVSTKFQLCLLDEKLPVYLSDVALDDKSDEAKRVQCRLQSLYYLGKGDLDGHAGKDTVAAITAFQLENDLDATGVADMKTQVLLFSDAARTNPMPYLVKVSIDEQRVYVLRRLPSGKYVQIREMLCSTGLGNSTPKGIFVDTWPQDRWHYFKKFFCWAQYTSVIYLKGDILFHSVLYRGRSEKTLKWSSVSNLGRKASHGCVRLAVEDAKWIYDNCKRGTPVVIY